MTAEPDVGLLRAALRDPLQRAHEAREVGLEATRQATRHAANAIRAVHRQDAAQVDERLGEAHAALQQAREALTAHPRLLHAGFAFDAEKELAEAELTAALVLERPLPTPEGIGVDPAAYAGGLAETVGELRRHALDRLRADDLEGADATLSAMESIFGVLEEVDLPDGVTGGLRRATDVARSLVERTRGDVTTVATQVRLRSALERAADAGPDRARGPDPARGPERGGEDR